MSTILESKNFIVEPHQRPEVDRLDGGHIVINPKVKIEDRQQLTPDQAKELMRLTILIGEAMKRYYRSIGLELHRVNYQDNGNWRPEQHVHLYGRAKAAKYQKAGDPIITGHKDEYQILNDEDVTGLRKEISQLLTEPNYTDLSWGFSLIPNDTMI
jgi:diadenosine tetraphosphate (Ap4A) HIT family hydrolase